MSWICVSGFPGFSGLISSHSFGIVLGLVKFLRSAPLFSSFSDFEFSEFCKASIPETFASPSASLIEDFLFESAATYSKLVADAERPSWSEL